MTTYLQVLTTLDDRNAAEKMAGDMIARKLAACVQIIPCRSIYRWQGRVEKAEEFLCIMKSSRVLYPELEKAIRDSHPYEVPEILAMEVAAGNPDYLIWLDQELLPAVSPDIED